MGPVREARTNRTSGNKQAAQAGNKAGNKAGGTQVA